LPKALPPTVKEAVDEISTTLKIDVFKSVLIEPIFKIKTAIVDPLIMPAMSPTTSLQKLETGPAWFISSKASFAPFIFLEAIELKGFLLAEATAMPMMSKMIPVITIIKSNKNPKANPILPRSVSETELSKNEKIKVIKETWIIHLYLILLVLIFIFKLPLKK